MDALYGVTALDGSTIKILNSTFDNNFKGVVMQGDVNVDYHGGNTYTQTGALASGQSEALCGVQISDNPGVNNLSDCANPNSYSDMRYGIVSRGSFARVNCDDFDNLSQAGIEAYGSLNGVNTLFAMNNTFDDCKTGIYTAQSHLNASQNILTNCEQGFFAQNNNVLNRIHENVIRGSLRGINSFLNGSLSVRDNKISVENNSPITALGYGVSDFLSTNTFINNNIVEAVGCQSGIEANNCNGDRVNENSVEISSNIVGRDIALLAGTGHKVSCNSTKLMSSSSSTESSGIYIDLTDDVEVRCNTTEDVEVGLLVENGSSRIMIRGNAFENDNLGLRIENSSIGKQEHEGNVWTGTGNAAGHQAFFEGSDVNLNQSKFFVDTGDGANLLPVTNLDDPSNGIESWFFDEGGSTFTCSPCSGGVGAQSTPFIDEFGLLSGLCDELSSNDSLSCEQKWLAKYNLYSIIMDQVKDVSKIKDDCLKDFMKDSRGIHLVNSTPLIVYCK